MMKTLTYNFDNLKYYAIRWDFNEDKPLYMNVFRNFDSEAFCEAVEKYKTINNYDELYRWVARELKYAFMSKSEFEMNINGLFGENEVQIDVWSQVVPNIEYITDIVNREFGFNFEKSLDKVKPELMFIDCEE